MFNIFLSASVFYGTRMEWHLPCLIRRGKDCGERRIKLYHTNYNARIFDKFAMEIMSLEDNPISSQVLCAVI